MRRPWGLLRVFERFPRPSKSFSARHAPRPARFPEETKRPGAVSKQIRKLVCAPSMRTAASAKHAAGAKRTAGSKHARALRGGARPAPSRSPSHHAMTYKDRSAEASAMRDRAQTRNRHTDATTQPSYGNWTAEASVRHANTQTLNLSYPERAPLPRALPA